MALRRILLIPQLGLRRVGSDSCFQDMLNTVESSERLGRREFFYMVLPDWAEGPLPERKNLHIERVSMSRDFFLNEMIGVPAERFAELFCRRGGRYVVDAIYTWIVRAAAFMSQVVSDYRSPRPIPVFFNDPIDMTNVVNKGWEHQMLNLFSYAATYPLIPEPSDAKETLAWLRSWFSATVVKEVESRICFGGVGIDMETIARIAAEERKHEKPSLFCGMRFNEEKGIKFILDVFGTLYARGRDIYVCSTTGTDEIRGVQQIPRGDTSMLKLMKFGVAREEYLREAARCHVFLSASKGETFALHIVEQLALGLIGVLPNAQWVFDSVPRDYPFIYDNRNRDEAYTMLSWVMDNYDRALELATPYMEFVRREYCGTRASQKLLEAMGEKIDRQRVDYRERAPRFSSRRGKRRKPFRFELCDVADSLGESFGAVQLVEAMKARAVGMDAGVMLKLGGPRLGVPTIYDLRMVLESYGWEDACDGPEVRFVRGPHVELPSKIWEQELAEAAAQAEEEDEEEAGNDGVEDEDAARVPALATVEPEL